MKRVILTTLVLLLGLFVGTSSAVEITLLGPNQYFRTTGKPDVYTDTFPGVTGKGKLIVKNGEKDDDHQCGKKDTNKDHGYKDGDKDDDHRVTCASILINGKQVLGPKHFSRDVYKIEVPVNLSSNNSISVELKSKPGTYLRVQITEEVPADAAAVITSGGGTISASNGMQIVIPSGAVDHNIVVAISSFPQDQLRIDPSEQIQVLGAVKMDIGDNILKINAELIIPKPDSMLANSQIYLGKIVSLPEKDLVIMVDTAHVEGNFLVTNAPACPGVVSSATYPFYQGNTACGVPDYQTSFAGKINPTCVDKLNFDIYLRIEDPKLVAENDNLFKSINNTLTENDIRQNFLTIADTMATFNGLGGKSFEELFGDSVETLLSLDQYTFGQDIAMELINTWVPLIDCTLLSNPINCTWTLGSTLTKTIFNGYTSYLIGQKTQRMHENSIASEYLIQYYSYGRNLSLMAQGLGLSANANPYTIIESIAHNYGVAEYDANRIVNIISATQLAVISFWRSVDPDHDGIVQNGCKQPSYVALPSITSSLRLIKSPPYYVGSTITAQFTITNKGTSSITLDVLTVGGRDPDGQIADFEWHRNITLEPIGSPNAFYTYQGQLTLSKVGTYHFFTAYRTLDGQWNASIPTENGVSNTLDITVSAPVPVLSSITITPGIAALTVGDTQQFTATAFDQFNNPMVPQPTFTWASSNTAIGTINATGLFSALSAGGTINVTASVGSISGSASVTVSTPAPILTSIGVNPATVTVTLASTQQFTATALDQYGNPIIPQPSFTWASSNTSIGTVSATGLFVAVSAGGPITITASVGLISGSASVIVSAPPLPPPLGGPWPMFQHDAQRTGRSPFVGPANLTNPTVGVFLMGEAANDYFKAPAIGSDGTIYLGGSITNVGISSEGVYAFALDGTPKWFYQTPYPQGTPALSETDGLVYIPSLQGLLAIDIQTGNLKWKKDFASLYYWQNPLLADDGSLYFISGCIVPDGSQNSCLVSFNKDGKVQWIYAIEKNETYYDLDLPEDCPTGGALMGSPSNPTIDKDGIIYFGYSDTLFALNPDGTEKWRRVFPVSSTNGFNIPGQENSKSVVLTPSIGNDGTIYVVAGGERYDTFYWNWDDCIHAVDPQNHLADKWPKTCFGYASSLFAIGPDGTLYNTQLYFGAYAWSPTEFLTAIDHSTGQTKWQKVLSYSYSGIPTVVDADGNVYAMSGQNQAIAFDQEGNQKWGLSLADRGGSLSLDRDGSLFIPGQTYLYTIGP